MEISLLIILLFTGCLMGMIAGFFGIGGGIILVPILLVIYKYIGVEPSVIAHVAFGTSLFVSSFVSLSSAYRHFKNKNMISKAILVLVFTSIITALLGSWIAEQLTGGVLKIIFSFVIIFSGIRLAFHRFEISNEKIPRVSNAGLAGIGTLTGFVSALSGVGGGVFSIPMMYQFLRYPINKAIGTSSAVVVFTTLFGAIGYLINGWGNPDLPSYSFGYIHYGTAIPVVITAVIFGQFGAMLTRKTEINLLRRLFGIFLICVGLYLILM